MNRSLMGLAFLAAWLTSSSVAALTTTTIATSTLSPQCLQYRVVGVCYWLYCTITGCTVRTSAKIRHYVPDAVVSSYADTGRNPWHEVMWMSPPNASAAGGGDGTTNEDHENNLAKFKHADVIGHPAGVVFNRFVSSFGYVCPGAGVPYTPYFLSVLDSLAWRHNVPESLYPEALIPGLREIGSLLTMDLWGAVYPRGGFLHQTDDHKAAAVVAQRAGDIVTRRVQPHVYRPLIARAGMGYWPAGRLIEGDASTGRWQELTPTLSPTCTVFPHLRPLRQAHQGDYAWALWRPYRCCERRGQVLLGSIDFN
jgi:integrating conjugative element protein (TIGR03756 family)